MAKKAQTAPVEESTLFADLLSETGNEYGAAVVDEGIAAGDISYYIQTGSFTLNALLSGSIYGGLPGNKIYAYAGEPSTGKTFCALSGVKKFQKQFPDGFVFYFESESAISKDMIAGRGVDTKRIAIVPVATVQEFRSQALRIVNKYLDTPKKGRPRIMFVLDSLGNLSTTKEMEDIAEGSDKRDMTRPQLVKAAFRVLTLKMGMAEVAMITTNHLYDVIGSYVPMKKMGGGSGLDYAASGIVFLTKKKDKDGKDAAGKDIVTGVILKATLKKSRLTIENKSVETRLNYQTGLDPYYGLVSLCLQFGIFKKMATKIVLPDGSTEFESKIEDNPEKYFTKDLLDEIDEKCKAEFLYGTTSAVPLDIAPGQ
jgi:RecA/RadA recombinase